MKNQNRILWMIAVFVMIFCPSFPSRAASPHRIAGNTYYVATSGSDANPGSQSQPWATIQHAVDSLDPGDTAVVLAGTYAGARLERSGTALAPLTLKAAPGASVVINSPGPNNRHDSNLEVETWEGDEIVRYWVIEGLEVANAPSWGIDLRNTEHITVRGNHVHDSGVTSHRTGIFAAFSYYVVIENNESNNNGEHGIYVNNSSDHFSVRGNRLHHNRGCGLHMNGDASMGGDGTLSAGLVENNIIYENGVAGGAGINMDGVETTLVRNNLLYSNHASGIAIYQIDGSICSRDNRIYNNTILMAADGRWPVQISDTACTGNQVFNNILYNNHSYRGSINLSNGVPAGFSSDYNVVMDRFSTDDGDTVIGLGAWQALGFDAHALIATPAELFVNASGANFHLKSSSPAIDQGFTLGEVAADIEGTPRADGAYDIGAYEYQSGVVVPPGVKSYLPVILNAP